MYEMHEVDELCDEGKLPRHFCKGQWEDVGGSAGSLGWGADCGSRSVEKLNFITHSLSIRELEFVFNSVLLVLLDLFL